MTLMNWDPMREFSDLRGAVNRLFEDAFSRSSGDRRGDLAVSNWPMPVDVSETNDSITVRAEIPGMKLEDIDITVTGDQLTIKGEKKFEQEDKGRNYLRVERRYGTFYRSFNLATPIDRENVTASYSGGILEIVLPKSHEAKPKQIKIKVEEN